MTTTIDTNRQEILELAMEELASFRKEAMALPEGCEIDAVIEAIAFYESELGSIKNIRSLIEWSGRALADVTQEIAAARFGFDSPEANAVFWEQEGQVDILVRSLQSPHTPTKRHH